MNLGDLLIIFMPKKCIVCEEKDAEFTIKGSSKGYCKECAEEHFGDISVLVKVEEQAKKIKEIVDSKIEENSEKEEPTE